MSVDGAVFADAAKGAGRRGVAELFTRQHPLFWVDYSVLDRCFVGCS